MTTSGTTYRTTTHTARNGAAVLVCIFVVVVMSILVISAVRMQTSRMAAARNAAAYEQSLYLAGAAAHHALAELEADTSWRDGLVNIQFPVGSGNTYSATVADDPPNGVIINASGTAAGITRKVQVSVSVGG
jgi:hypothetical protein